MGRITIQFTKFKPENLKGSQNLEMEPSDRGEYTMGIKAHFGCEWKCFKQRNQWGYCTCDLIKNRTSFFTTYKTISVWITNAPVICIL